MTLGHLLIRADASAEIGTGHVMRCLALAQAWQDEGGQVTFAVLDSLPAALTARLESERMNVHLLRTEAGSSDDAQQTLELARLIGPVCVVVDGYQFGAEYQRAIKGAGLRLLFIDDNGHAEHYFADWVLNQNIHADAALYASREPYTQLLLGTRYVLLRREFLRWRGYQRDIPEVARKILVTMGGSDPDNVTGKVLAALDEVTIDRLDVVAVIGGGNPNEEMLREQARRARHTVRLEHNVADMPALMAWADMAISAGGSTVWELAFMGVPMSLLALAANQQSGVRQLVASEVAAEIGWDFRSLTALMADRSRRALMSVCGQALCDGFGALRVVQKLTGAYPALRLREGQPEDIFTIWQWANDPATRANSFNSAPIAWEEHRQWYLKKLASCQVRFWILEAGKLPVAQVRYDVIDEDTAQISYTVAPEQRGQGFGTRALEMSRQRACTDLAVGCLRGITFTSNTASIRAFEKAGFTRKAEAIIEGHLCLVYEWECHHVG